MNSVLKFLLQSLTLVIFFLSSTETTLTSLFLFCIKDKDKRLQIKTLDPPALLAVTATGWHICFPQAEEFQPADPGILTQAFFLKAPFFRFLLIHQISVSQFVSYTQSRPSSELSSRLIFVFPPLPTLRTSGLEVFFFGSNTNLLG